MKLMFPCIRQAVCMFAVPAPILRKANDKSRAHCQMLGGTTQKRKTTAANKSVLVKLPCQIKK